MSRNSKDPKKERLEKHNQVLRFGDIYPLLKPIMSICRDEPTMFEFPSCKQRKHRQENLARTRMMLFIGSKN
jgi:hypothetical protein